MKNAALCFVCLMLLLSQVVGQVNYQPSRENLEARKWFQDARFGLFVHWGVYSVLGDGEWVMQNKQMTKATYQKLPPLFNPVAFDPAEWVAMAKSAGMKYITITSKHHDGFCMFDSKLTDWDIVDRTPYVKDVLKLLADECHKQGIKLFFYYSQLDWNNNDYYPRGYTGQYAGRPDEGDWNNYLKYMNGQLAELLTNYGQIGGIWFDGWWDRKDADWKLDETYGLIHRLQPSCLIGSNHHRAPKPGEDFQMFEKDLPGQNTAGHSGESEVGTLPLETCETMNRSWGFNITDYRYKSSGALIQYLVKAAGNNANFLLNVGPMPNGKIQPEFVDTLKVIGKWMQQYGETIYGTRGGPVAPRDWGVTTHKDNRVFVHILDWIDHEVFLPGLNKEIASVSIYGSPETVNYASNKCGTVIELPQGHEKEVDLVVEIELKDLK
jgi:alpha-L-fucosidase